MTNTGEAIPELTASQKRNIVIAMCMALIAVVASVTGLNVAQRQIAESLDASAGDVLWVINIYTLTLAALLLPVGAIGDRWGRRPVLLSGLGIFAVATLAAALAPSVEVMIVARALSGVGAAMVMPVTLSVITTSFPPEERGQAIGLWAGFSGAGAIIGIWMSAAMVDLLSWRWLYSAPLLMIVASAVLAYIAVPNSRERARGFDMVGSILSAVAIGGMVFGIHEGPEEGWTAPIALCPVLAGFVALIAFVWWERRTDDPLLDVSAFTDRRLASGTVTITLHTAVMFGVFLVQFPFLQTVFGWSALFSAFAMMPLAGTMMPTSALLAPRVSRRFGRRVAMLLGMTFAAVGLCVLATLVSVDNGYWPIFFGLVALGAGSGILITPATDAITDSLPGDKQGVASALNDTSRELGGAIGVALLGSILTAGYTSSVTRFAETLSPSLAGPVEEDYFVALGVAQEISEDSPGLAEQIVDAAQRAYADSWNSTILVGLSMLAVAFVYVAVAGPRRAVREPEPSESPLVAT